MKLTGRIIDSAVGRDGKAKLTFQINEKADAFQCFDDFNQIDKLSIEVKEYRNHRSLNANAYA